jgi:hypothetical protein
MQKQDKLNTDFSQNHFLDKFVVFNIESAGLARLNHKKVLNVDFKS